MPLAIITATGEEMKRSTIALLLLSACSQNEAEPVRPECQDVFFETTCTEMQDYGMNHIICYEIDFQEGEILLNKESLSDADFFSRLEEFDDFVPRPMIAIREPQSSKHRPQTFWLRIGNIYECEVGSFN